MSSTTTERSLDLSLSESELERHREHITDFIAAQADAAGVDTGIIALSGGIDSTLTAYLAVEALGADSVYGLVLPSEVNREGNMSDAERVASELLDVEYDVVGINPIVDAVLEAHPGAEPGGEPADETEKVAVGNLRARVRTVLNYFAANRRGGLVLGTGNKSEALVGYFTKYGDGAVDCLPIANLYKQQVRQLARHVGVPEDLAGKTASAELWTDQTDEEELGLDYDTLDAVLALHVDGPLSVSATARHLRVEESVVERVRGMYERSAHKRAFPPGPDPLY
ncbi:NAD+ synthase [Salinirussus salinus]|uniref:NAD+ synthase n=1 Tax=Salinirussus salinus TaxID=1198300 RepID=UPI00135C895E|nr:NAD+ synthase [Salinirussus salinus]